MILLYVSLPLSYLSLTLYFCLVQEALKRFITSIRIQRRDALEFVTWISFFKDYNLITLIHDPTGLSNDSSWFLTHAGVIVNTADIYLLFKNQLKCRNFIMKHLMCWFFLFQFLLSQAVKVGGPTLAHMSQIIKWTGTMFLTVVLWAICGS